MLGFLVSDQRHGTDCVARMYLILCKSFGANEGMTLHMVTHEMSFDRKVADRVIVMHHG